MHTLTRFRSFISFLSVLCLVLATGCGNQPAHPNQLNAFDGASYDTLTVVHGALTSLRAQVAVSHPKYIPLFNEAADSYAVAYNAYALYRTTPTDPSGLSVAIANLTVSIVALEDSFQTDMQVPPAVVAGIRKKAKSFRALAAGRNITLSDILTDLEIAAAVAGAVPAASVYAGLASMVIAATSAALAAEAAAAGQAINLTTIQPLATL